MNKQNKMRQKQLPQNIGELIAAPETANRFQEAQKTATAIISIASEAGWAGFRLAESLPWQQICSGTRIAPRIPEATCHAVCNTSAGANLMTGIAGFVTGEKGAEEAMLIKKATRLTP